MLLMYFRFTCSHDIFRCNQLCTEPVLFGNTVDQFQSVKRTCTPGLKMAAAKIQHKNCSQSTLRKKNNKQAVLKTEGTVFPITDLPAAK